MRTIITLDDKKFGGSYYKAAHVEIIDENNIHSAKYVNINQLLNELTGSKVEDERFYRIGKMPQNYYDGVIRRGADDQLSGQILITIPKQKTTMQFENTRYNMCFPALLFSYSITNCKIQQTQVYALKGNKWNDKSMLYNYPFGNVNTYGHSVCWGSNTLPAVESLQTLDVVCSLFYSSPCNNDHYNRERSTKWKKNNLREILEKLKQMKEFPDKILVASDRGNIGNLSKFK
ncbi:MAG: hypothetical protein PHE06_16010 [Lachnospiraceae bacterium]|nr:hypothetical protein [Lachnospiraceae bacterium]